MTGTKYVRASPPYRSTISLYRTCRDASQNCKHIFNTHLRCLRYLFLRVCDATLSLYFSLSLSLSLSHRYTLAHTHTHMHTHTHTNTSHAHTHIQIHLHTHTHKHMNTHTHTCTYTHIRTRTHIYMKLRAHAITPALCVTQQETVHRNMLATRLKNLHLSRCKTAPSTVPGLSTLLSLSLPVSLSLSISLPVSLSRAAFSLLCFSL